MAYINVWAILVSAVVSMVIGSVWYGPLFGKKFMSLMGMDQWSPERQAAEKKKMPVSYLVQFLASLVMFYVLANFMDGLRHMTPAGGMVIALWSWFGFVVPIKLADALWGGKMGLFWLSAGNMLLTLLAAGAIIGAWK